MANSWQAYVDKNLVGSGQLIKAAIHGHNSSKWATSVGLEIKTDEMNKIIAGFKDPTGLRANGIFIAGSKYFALRADDRSIYGKLGSGGCICVKTTKAVLIGIYGEKAQPGQAANVVEKLADYLIEQGY